jgi:cysteine protease ATG4
MNTFKHRAIRYFWDPEPRNEDPASMIWCLGQQYNANIPSQTDTQGSPTTTTTTSFSSTDPSSTWPPEFLDDFESRIWMTYRTDFIPIPRSLGKPLSINSPAAALHYAGKLLSGQAGDGFSSDVGWGCMIRSAQSVLANALITLHLGRGTSPDSDVRLTF